MTKDRSTSKIKPSIKYNNCNSCFTHYTSNPGFKELTEHIRNELILTVGHSSFTTDIIWPLNLALVQFQMKSHIYWQGMSPVLSVHLFIVFLF